MKKFALAALTSGYVSPLVRPLVRGADTILTLHRFADAAGGVRGQDIAALRSDLAYLRKNRYDLVGVSEIVTRFVDRVSGSRSAIAFTVDDGYYDWFQHAAPVFAEFDCPVTVFVTTGFVDGTLWNWWDKVEHILLSTSRASLHLPHDDGDWSYQWGAAAERERAAASIVRRLERIPTAHKLDLIAAMATTLDVELPDAAPPRYSAMTWENVRSAAARGATFGPHTVTHPILAQCTDAECRFEIEESWRRLREETDAAVSVFAYPNGQPHAVTPREAEEVRRIGMKGAVTTRQRYVEQGAARAGDLAPYLVPRFPYPVDRAHLIQLTTGLERAKLALARAVGAGQRAGAD